MIASWNIVIVILLSLQLVNLKAEKNEAITEASKLSAGAKPSGDGGKTHSRPKRVGTEPPKAPVTVADTENNKTVTNATSTGSEAKDMITPVVKPSGPVPETAGKTVAVPPVAQNGTKGPDLPGNSESGKVTTPKTPTANNTSPNGIKVAETTGKNVTSPPVSQDGTKVPNLPGQTEKVTTPKTPAANNTSPTGTKTAEIVVTEGPPPRTFPINESERINEASDLIKKQLGYNISVEGETHTTDVTGKSNATTLTEFPNNLTLTIETSKVPKESREEMVKMSERIELKRKRKERLSGGMIALIASTVFACLATLGYVGMIVRKRYIAYRQENRELLVNDFETNDINTYEL